MGKTFKYINDLVLMHYCCEEEKCQLCGSHAQVFFHIIDHPEVYAEYVCSKCLRSLPLRMLRCKGEKVIPAMIDQFYSKGTLSRDERFALAVDLCDEYRRTPKLPNFCQNEDWPFCCGDFTEFQGDAGESFQGPYDGVEMWAKQQAVSRSTPIEDAIGGEDRVSLFNCFKCTKKYWTSQST